ncbi:MAG: DUF1566 domain-containing protein [Saprospiraceae bacterium]|nr:DUF1566 domain-containing protein [Saprospiraceae bacterium]
MKNKNLLYILPLMCFTLTLINSCKKDDISSSLIIGQSYQGGKIAYILQPGDSNYIHNTQHGLIAAPNDHSSDIQWYDKHIYNHIGITSSKIGTGSANTNTIVNLQGEGTYAAKLCLDLVLNGYDDWYLPSYYELTTLYSNKLKIGNFDPFGYYWSSTENNEYYNWGFDFDLGKNHINLKDGFGKVRAIRSF